MTVVSELQGVRVVDTDSHIIEPPDLWTSRVPEKWHDLIPRVDVRPGSTTGKGRWHIGDMWMHPPGYLAAGGWHEYPPSAPNTLDEIDRAAFDPSERLKRLDEYGLYAQVLYPNIVGFSARAFMAMPPEVALACSRAYNDYITEFASTDPKRLVPVTFVPFWDIEASIAEIHRGREMGHRAVLFANQYEKLGLPPFYDPHWDPIYAVAQDLDMSINFHVGFASDDLDENVSREAFDPRNSARRNALAMMVSNGTAISHILTSGICDRFPTLKWVSVESGMGYLPWLLENLDWHWKGHGAHIKHPMLPSEYFRRQCYGTFWYETSSLQMLKDYPDNFMFETDFPHPTSLTPGPASPADAPNVHIEKNFRSLPADVARKALHDNAARLYFLD